MTFTDKRAAQTAKLKRLVRGMPDADAWALIKGGHDNRKAWMLANLDGCWGQNLEAKLTRALGVKVGVIKNAR